MSVDQTKEDLKGGVRQKTEDRVRNGKERWETREFARKGEK